MRHQKRTLIILLAVLAALVLLILVGIPLLTGSGEETPKEEEEKIYLCSLSKSEVKRIEYAREGIATVLTCADNGWQAEGHSQAPNADAVSNMVSAVCGLYSTQLAFTGEEHFAQCGLDAPTLTVTASGDAGSVTIRVGSYNNGLDRWYCTVDGVDTVYLIGNNLCNRFSAELF